MNRIAAGLTVLIVLVCPFTAYHLSQNTYLLGTARENMPQYRFAAKIRQTEEQTLLNVGFLDGGFYYAAGTLPVNPYFCTLNISLPEMDKAIDGMIQNGEVAYVVTRQRQLEWADAYRLIDESSLSYEGRSWTYYLYRRSDLLS